MNLTRAVAAFTTAILLLAVALLYLFPADTDRLFAWTIQPPATALFMGAGYAGGVWLFGRLAFGGRWERVDAAWIGIWLFTIAALAATLFHLDRFHHGHPALYLWIGVYAVLPFLLGWVWVLNRGCSGGPAAVAESSAIVPRPIRILVGLIGRGSLVLATLLFLAPEAVLNAWPWPLTALTARVLGSFYVLSGVIGVSLATRDEWWRWRAPIQSQLIGFTLLLLALPRSWSDLRLENPVTWLFVVATISGAAGLAALYGVMDRRSQQPA